MKENSNISHSSPPNTHGFDQPKEPQEPKDPKESESMGHSSLGHKERKLLAIALLQSAGILALVTVLLAYLIVALKTGNPIACLLDGSWLTFLLDQCTLPPQWWCAPLVMIGIYIAVNLIARLVYPNYKRDELDLRQGLNGELILLPVSFLATLIPLTNIFEETVFRGCLIPLLTMGAMALGLNSTTSALVAVAGSTLVFWLVHWQYRNKLSVAMTLVGGATLGIIYVISQSVLVCIIAHVAYNWFVLYFERMIARDDPNYFGGKQPTHYVSDLLE